MSATISYSSNRVTIDGPYKEFLASSSLSLVTFSSGEAPAAGDVGRFILWCRGGTSVTAQWEVRRIIAATATTVTVHDDWRITPSAGDTFRISSTMDDILTAQPTAGTKTGNSQFYIDGDFSLTNNAFLGSADEAVEWAVSASTSRWLLANNTVLQLGQLWGGEGVGTETTNGSRFYYRLTSVSSTSLYSNTNSRSGSGAVINYYGSIIESFIDSTTFWMFQRLRGPSRFIGTTLDGVMGGRFYHEASEFVDVRTSGNNNVTVPWGIAVVFDRVIDNVFFFQNDYAFKTYQGFAGVFRNCRFADSNVKIIFVNGNTSAAIIEFIDCTTFDDSKIQDSGSNTIRQKKSVNYTITDSDGIPVSGVTVRINDKDDTTQDDVEVSDVSGNVGEILTTFREWVNSSPSSVLSPFRIRIRGYDYLWFELPSDIPDKIIQSVTVIDDPDVTQTSAAAQAHTGISITDHGGSPVSWQSKNWGITVTGNLTTNPSLDIDDIKHYLKYHLSQNASFNGKNNGLEWHDLIPMAGTETQLGDYGGTDKGVRVVDENGDPFPGITRMQADDGTYYVPPASVQISFTTKDQKTKALIEDVRITVEAKAGGPLAVGTVITDQFTPASGLVSVSTEKNQPLRGWAKKGTLSPFYTTFEIDADSGENGFDQTILLTRED